MVLLSRLPILRTQAFSLRITNGLEYNGCFGEVTIYLVMRPSGDTSILVLIHNTLEMVLWKPSEYITKP